MPSSTPAYAGEFRKILKSDDPQIRANASTLAAMYARRERQREHWLAEQFHLTASEARLAVFIGGGGSIAAYAEMRGVSESTTRTHLKAVFAKTGLHRQADLVRLLAEGH